MEDKIGDAEGKDADFAAKRRRLDEAETAPLAKFRRDRQREKKALLKHLLKQYAGWRKKKENQRNKEEENRIIEDIMRDPVPERPEDILRDPVPENQMPANEKCSQRHMF